MTEPKTGKCRCEVLPADFSVGIGHARKCPAGHAYAPRGGINLVPKPCACCGWGVKEHPLPLPTTEGDPQ